MSLSGTAILLIGGKQFRVKSGSIIDISAPLTTEAESVITVPVLSYIDEKEVLVGTPVLESVTAKIKISEPIAGEKGIAYKYKRRKGYQRKVGFRAKYFRAEVIGFEKVEKAKAKSTAKAAK